MSMILLMMPAASEATASDEPMSFGPRATSRPSVRIGVLGLGQFGLRHLQGYRALGVEVVAVADRLPGRAELIARQHQVDRWFTSGTEMIESCDLDGVSIAADPADHPDLAMRAARQGTRVLLEKPIATSRDDADRLLSAPEGMIMPGHVLRFAPIFQELRRRVAAGEIGTVVGFSARRDRANWHSTRYACTHLAYMTTIHDIDLAVWIGGSNAISVTASSPQPAALAEAFPIGSGALTGGPMNQPIDLVFAEVRAADGTIWSLRGSWLLPPAAPPSDRFEVYGTKGVAVVDVGSTETTLAVGSPQEVVSVVPTDDGVALERELQHFCRCVEDDCPSAVVTLAEARHAVAVSAAIVESARTGSSRILIEG